MTADERAERIRDDWTTDMGRGHVPPDGMIRDIAAAIRAAVEEEREACAKVIDERADDWKRTWEAFLASGNQGPATSLEAIYRDMAAAIRARGQAAT